MLTSLTTAIMSAVTPRLTRVLLCLLVTACGGNDKDDSLISPVETSLQQELSAYIRADLIPHTDPSSRQKSAALEKLGMELFFSKSLSGNFDVACASCHHPLLAGGDKLSLPVGESAYNPNLLGPGRWHDWRASMDHKADGAPNVARHSPTTFNSSLYQRALFADGRVFLQTPHGSFATQPGIRSPDSRFAQLDTNAGEGLLATQTRFPVTSNEEMRGFAFAPGMSNDEVRLRIVQRLKGQSAELDHNQWLDHFRIGFNAPTATADELITFNTIQQALAAYQSSQVLINNSWYRYLGGDTNALSEQQKRGALLFFKAAEKGGANCAACHQPPVFSDEKYHNIAMIQFGRGKRAGHEDFGRRGVTQREQDRYRFRTPSLLNVEHTAPYGHTGAYLDLESIIRHHLDPTAAIDNFDFAFRENPQLKHVASLYDNARQLSRDALKTLKVNQQKNTSLLAEGINLSDTEISDLAAFLATLTDPCIASVDCLQQWIPHSDDPDPDNMRLIAEFAESDTTAPENLRNVPGPDLKVSALAPQTGKLTPEIDLRCNTDMPVITPRSDDQAVSSNFQFVDSTKAVGIDLSHFIEPEIYDIKSMQRLSFSGGAAAGDIDGDCFNDIYYVTGSKTPDALYINNSDGTFTNQAESWHINQRELSNGASFVDIDGDGDLDLFTSNIIHPDLSPITGNNANAALIASTSYRNEQQKEFSLWPELSIQATVASWSFAFADYDADGDLDVLSSHWQFSPAQTQHLWRNENGVALTAVDDESGLNHIHGNRDLSFTGIFSDANNDGYADILMTADFEDSQIFINAGNARFIKKTRDSQITDENGMGAAVIDIDNDGDLDWFVTSIWDPRKTPPVDRNWGLSGNRLYQNNDGVFIDISEKAGVRQGYWGWGSCFADFNNDGWPDIFHVNGFGFADKVKQHLLNRTNKSAQPNQSDNFHEAPIITQQLFSNIAPFEKTASRLYISNRNGGFTDQASAWGISDTEQGRAVICMDYDRDGDIDIFVSNNQSSPILYKNNARSLASTNFINISLRGRGRNSQSVGARVYVTANGITQLQEVKAGGSFISGSPAELHFGLGDATVVDRIEIIWPQPNYIKHQLRNIAGNRFITIIQPDE